MSETVTVDAGDGTLRGKKATSKSGKTYYSFKGVPFAKPPLGPLRFKVPQPLEPWSGVRDALQDGSSCTQYNFNDKHYEGSEDCLYLNVYSPQLPPTGSQHPLKPVMVYIHGGGFVFGSNSGDSYGPDYLVDEGVVLVVLNYRLGIFGFLCLDDPVAPGNVGLKDQVAALRWVQRNIAKFGGDPKNVTIFGESAGGVAVHFHMLSPMSKGLFRKAIAMSGVTLNAWGMEKHPREAAYRVANALGFSGNQPEDLVEFLRGVDHMKLLSASIEHGLSDLDKERIMAFPFVPTLEMEAEGTERFLPASPLELLEEGRYHAVPCMAGFTTEEGLLTYLYADYKNLETLKRIEKDFEKIIRPDLRLPKKYKKTEEVAAKIWKFFMKYKPLTEETLPAFIDMYSDVHFSEGVHVVMKKMAQLAKAPLYYYDFAFDGKLNTFKINNQIDAPGACHADDLGYLFRYTSVDPELAADSPDFITRARMVKLWTNFAKTGNPTPEVDSLLPVEWPQYTPADPFYLDISEKLSVKKHPLKERMKFWEELYRTL